MTFHLAENDAERAFFVRLCLLKEWVSLPHTIPRIMWLHISSAAILRASRRICTVELRFIIQEFWDDLPHNSRSAMYENCLFFTALINAVLFYNNCGAMTPHNCFNNARGHCRPARGQRAILPCFADKKHGDVRKFSIRLKMHHDKNR